MRKSSIVLISAALAALLASPFIVSLLSPPSPPPRPELPRDVKECVRPAAQMRAEHMVLLHQWRDDVVRRGDRREVMIGGVSYAKSLTGSCMKCHRHKEKFCDRCHGALSSAPKCWDCHVYRKEVRP
ncbi:MAG: sulfate reduction electron transfer complex DsrMKJOP subunit DsrJ [Spirochaetes bacterium]|nr:sulfate reduction electron transfer complex DsrMKJOP subunit DsrJ [Spirochaetota bacterium]